MQKSLLSKVTASLTLSLLLFSCASNSAKAIPSAEALSDALSKASDVKNNKDTQADAAQTEPSKAEQLPESTEGFPSQVSKGDTPLSDEAESDLTVTPIDLSSEDFEKVPEEDVLNTDKETVPEVNVNAEEGASEENTDKDSSSFLVPEELIDKTPLPEPAYGESAGSQPYSKPSDPQDSDTSVSSQDTDNTDNAALSGESGQKEEEAAQKDTADSQPETLNAQAGAVSLTRDEIQEEEKQTPEAENTAESSSQAQVTAEKPAINAPEEKTTTPVQAETQVSAPVTQSNKTNSVPEESTANKTPQPQITPAAVQSGKIQTTEDSPASVKEDKNDSITFKEATDEELTKPVVIIPSRAVTVKNNQYLDIVYPGSGWIYLGEADNTRLLSYFGRKLGSKDTSFTLRSRAPGITFLHFYKNDVLTGKYIDDYLQVTVTEETAKSGERETAPSYASVVPKQPERRQVEEIIKTENIQKLDSQSKKVEKNDTAVTSDKESSELLPVIQTTEDSAGEVTSATDIISTTNIEENNTATKDAVNSLAKAQEAYNNKEYEKALSLVKEYINTNTTLLDKAYYLQGQILEAQSPVRNIRSAIDSYGYVIKNYPASDLWKSANNRTTYLKRFYIDIR